MIDGNSRIDRSAAPCGTPDSEKVDRTESHGCFRLANRDARFLLKLVRVGLPVMVDE